MRIDIERGEAGLFYATSPDIRGLLAIGRTREEADRAVPGAIADLRRAASLRDLIK